MKHASLGGTGWLFSWAQVPFSLSSYFFPSFSFTHFRKLSWLWGCLICSMCAKSLQSCLTLCGPMDCSPPGSSGILQARILEWASMPSFRGSSWPLNPRVLCLLLWQAGSLPLAPTSVKSDLFPPSSGHSVTIGTSCLYSVMMSDCSC